jgi:hypothetical protein
MGRVGATQPIDSIKLTTSTNNVNNSRNNNNNINIDNNIDKFMTGPILTNKTLLQNLGDSEENEITVEMDATKTLILR